MPSFTQVLLALNDTWTGERERVNDSSARIMEHIGSRNDLIVKSKSDFTKDEISFAVTSGLDSLASSFDPTNGGFGDAPKFPPSLALEFLLRNEALQRLAGSETDFRGMQMIEHTCNAMARGGMYDQLAGGFARYSVDATWTVPHFEKMLYDNAQLLSIYSHLYRLTGDEQALRVTTETAEFLIREMLTPEGGFAAALDADSTDLETGHSEEGAFYAWTPQQIREVLGTDSQGASDAEWVIQLCKVTETGTFEHGKSVLTLLCDPDDWNRWNALRAKLFTAREARPRPGRDDKIVASWNGLAIRAMVDAGSVCDRPDWIECATRAADLLVSTHLGADPKHPSRLVRVSRDGKAGLHALGVLEDQALVASAFLSLAQANGDDAWRELAGTLLNDIKDHFQQDSGLTDTANDVEPVAKDVATRQVDPTDNVTPSGWAATIDAALTYSALSGDIQMRTWAEKFIPALIPLVASHTRFAGWGSAMFATWLDGPREVAIVGSNDSDFRAALTKGTAPGMVYAWGSDQPLLVDRKVVDGKTTAYVCRGFVCDAPTTDLQSLKNSIGVFG
jgi:uncharacterized protein YyaL (SSP411 family)